MPSIPSADFLIWNKITAISLLSIALSVLLIALFIFTALYVTSLKAKLENMRMKKQARINYEEFVNELLQGTENGGEISRNSIHFGQTMSKMGRIEAFGIFCEMRISKPPFSPISIPCCKKLEEYLKGTEVKTDALLLMSGNNGLGKTYSAQKIAERIANKGSSPAITLSVNADELLNDPEEEISTFPYQALIGKLSKPINARVRVKENLKTLMVRTNDALRKAGIKNPEDTLKVLLFDEFDNLMKKCMQEFKDEKWLLDCFSSENSDFKKYGFKPVASMNQCHLLRKKDAGQNLIRFIKSLNLDMNCNKQYFKFEAMTRDQIISFIENKLSTQLEMKNFLGSNLSQAKRDIPVSDQEIKEIRNSWLDFMNKQSNEKTFDLRSLASQLSSKYTEIICKNEEEASCRLTPTTIPQHAKSQRSVA